jgi:hypothetical protein
MYNKIKKNTWEKNDGVVTISCCHDDRRVIPSQSNTRAWIRRQTRETLLEEQPAGKLRSPRRFRQYKTYYFEEK